MNGLFTRLIPHNVLIHTFEPCSDKCQSATTPTKIEFNTHHSGYLPQNAYKDRVSKIANVILG